VEEVAVDVLLSEMSQEACLSYISSTNRYVTALVTLFESGRV
jgi:hypothetical protein